MTRINIELPEQLHQQLRLEAAKQETTIKKLVTKYLEEET